MGQILHELCKNRLIEGHLLPLSSLILFTFVNVWNVP